MNRELLLERAQRLIDAHPFPGAEATALMSLLDRCQPMRLMDGAELCREGEPGSTMFFLVEGAIRVTRIDPRGQPRTLARLDAPALVGHMAVADGSPRSATCTATGSVRVMVLDRATWQSLMGEPSVEGSCLRRLQLSSLCQQLSAGNRELRTLLAGAELEEDLPEIDIDPADPEDIEPTIRRPPAVVIPVGPGIPRDRRPVDTSLYGEDPLPDASSLLTEADLLEVSGILEGWKTRRF